MAKIASIHSFGGGNDTRLAANLVVSIAQLGYRIGVLDTGTQGPSIHDYFGLDSELTDSAWNAHVWEYDLTYDHVHDGHGNGGVVAFNYANEVRLLPPFLTEGKGEIAVMGRGIYLVPFTIRASDISQALRDGYAVEPLRDGIAHFAERLHLDYLLIDTHPGTTEETVFSIALSDTLLVVLRPDQLEYQETAVTVEIGRQLHVPKILLVVHNVPADYDITTVHEQVENIFNTVVAGVLPSSIAAETTGGPSIFCRQHGDHPWSQQIASIARQIIE